MSVYFQCIAGRNLTIYIVAVPHLSIFGAGSLGVPKDYALLIYCLVSYYMHRELLIPGLKPILFAIYLVMLKFECHT
ncbi:hypothetical protein GYMLUDRAFT_416262 [Collybiopsis luxurians FD-317 M1]|nr:hypothetical protein GYMLUDRAFT_416262 [Collybiopsis luxurians FD-317 M1]